MDISCWAQLPTVHTHKAFYWFIYLFKVYAGVVMFIHLFWAFLWDCSKNPFIFSKCKVHSFHFIGKQSGIYRNGVFLVSSPPLIFNVRFPLWKLWNIPCLPEKSNHLSHEMLMSRMSGAIFTARRGSLESQSCWRVVWGGEHLPSVWGRPVLLSSSLFTRPQIIFGSSLTKINGGINIYWTNL